MPARERGSQRSREAAESLMRCCSRCWAIVSTRTAPLCDIVSSCALSRPLAVSPSSPMGSYLPGQEPEPSCRSGTAANSHMANASPTTGEPWCIGVHGWLCHAESHNSSTPGLQGAYICILSSQDRAENAQSSHSHYTSFSHLSASSPVVHRCTFMDREGCISLWDNQLLNID